MVNNAQIFKDYLELVQTKATRNRKVEELKNQYEKMAKRQSSGMLIDDVDKYFNFGIEVWNAEGDLGESLEKEYELKKSIIEFFNKNSLYKSVKVQSPVDEAYYDVLIYENISGEIEVKISR